MFQSVYLQCVHMLPIETSNRSLSKLPDGNFPTEVYRNFPQQNFIEFPQRKFIGALSGAVDDGGRCPVPWQHRRGAHDPRDRAHAKPMPAVVHCVNQVQAEQSHAKVSRE
jgi:hypothetical protein